MVTSYFAFLAINHKTETLDFATYENVSLAFSALLSMVHKGVKGSPDFSNVKTACLTHADKKLSKEIKRTRDFDRLFELFAVNKLYCNWINITFLEVIVNASANSKLISLIKNYKTIIFSKTLREVWDHIPHHKAKTNNYSKLVAKVGKDSDNVTVKELTQMCPKLIKDIAELIAVIKEKSLKITWLIPTNLVYQAYLSALIIPQESRLDSYLQIGDWIVYHPLHVLQSLLKVYCE